MDAREHGPLSVICMNESAITRLTEKQKECLRLVARGHTSKEIARALGISAHTVDAYLKGAIRLLKVINRFEAARQFAAFEAESPYQPLVYQPLTIAPEPLPVSLDPATNIAGTEGEAVSVNEVQEDRAVYEVVSSNRDPGFPLPFPTRGRERNDLTVLVRIGWIILIMAALAIGTGVLLEGLAGVARLIRALKQ